MEATRVVELDVHAPIECGCLRAYCFTALATRRSELLFAKHRVHRATEHLGVTGLDLLLGVVLRALRVVGDLVALPLQLLDRGLKLRHGRTDIGQLDDVRFRRLGQLAELREVVILPLR